MNESELQNIVEKIVASTPVEIQKHLRRWIEGSRSKSATDVARDLNKVADTAWSSFSAASAELKANLGQ